MEHLGKHIHADYQHIPADRIDKKNENRILFYNSNVFTVFHNSDYISYCHKKYCDSKCGNDNCLIFRLPVNCIVDAGGKKHITPTSNISS